MLRVRLLRPGTISGYYVPLVFWAVLMALSHSVIHAGLARTASPELAIATFALALSLVHLIEVPLHPLPQVVMSFANGRAAWAVILRFVAAVLVVVLVLHGFVVLTSLGPNILLRFYAVPEQLMGPVLSAYRLGIVLSVVAAFRALWHGLLYRYRKTSVFGVAMVVRLAAMVGFLFAAIHGAWLHPALLGVATLLVGIGVEGLVSAWGARQILTRELPAGARVPALAARAGGSWVERRYGVPGAGSSQESIVPFYAPLMLSSGAAVILMPLVQAGLARSATPEEALAVFAVAMGLAAIITAPLHQLHKAVMSFAGTGAGRQQAWRFACVVGGSATFIMFGLVWTPLGAWVLTGPMGLPQELLAPTLGVLRVLALAPLVLALQEYLTGVQLERRRSRPMAAMKAVQLTVTALLMIVFIGGTGLHPAMAAALAWLGGLVTGSLYLLHTTVRLPRQLRAEQRPAPVGD